MTQIKGISVFSGKPVLVTVEETKISAVEELSSSAVGAGGEDLPFIGPGFLDAQVNGFNGVDYSLEDLNAAGIETLILRLARSGTTRHVPTFVTMPNERLLRNLRLTVEAMERNPAVKAGIAGFHLEGPFISSEDGPRGAHDKKYTQRPDFSLFREWQAAAAGLIKYITLAPELPGAFEFIKAALDAGVKVSIGHTAASPEQISEAVAAGAVCSTHLGNGSHIRLPRLKNYLWEQLSADSLWAGIICDGFHLPEAVVKTFRRAKGPERLFLVSDAALLGGFGPGVYKWGEQDVEVFPDGHLGMYGAGVLAGAAHLLDWDLARYMEFTGASLKEAVSLCTLQPARFLGLDTSEYSALTPGNTANLTVFFYKPGDKQLGIQKSICGGTVIFG